MVTKLMKLLFAIATLARRPVRRPLTPDHRIERAAMRKLDMHMDVERFIIQLYRVKVILSDRHGFDASQSQIASAVRELSDRLAVTSGQNTTIDNTLI